jgi:hypothetical protein
VKRPGLAACILLPSVAVGAVTIAVLAARGSWWALAFVPGTAIAVHLVRFTWNWWS